MIPARPVAASVVALGFAGTLTAPLPAFAVPAICDQPRHYAAQSSAELLRIDRLDLGPKAGVANRKGAAASEAASGTPGKSTSSGTAGAGPGSDAATSGSGSGQTADGADPDEAEELNEADHEGGEGAGTGGSGGEVPDLGREHRATTLPAWEGSTGGQGGGAEDTAISGVGLGETRSVLIADGPVNSAGAARILNGQVAGTAGRNDLVTQQAPPVKPKAEERRTGSQRFGPAKVGDGSLSARAVWAHGTACGSAGGDTSTATAEISRITVAGGGSGSLVRVPEKISSRSGTALLLRGATAQSVASATITAGRISLADNEVRIRVLQAPELRASMAADGQGQVDYQPAVVEVSGKNGRRTRLATAGDHIDITLSEEMRPLESLPVSLEPISELPLPKVPGLPVPGEQESTPVPGNGSASTMRITLGDARQATSGSAVAARATAIRVTVTRQVDKGRTGSAYEPSGVVADLGIGMLEAAAVAPSGAASVPAGSGTRPAAAGAGAGAGAAGAGLPITGPRVVSLFLAGAGLVVGGICAVVLTARRRRNEP